MDDNTFKGQLMIFGYTTEQFLSRNPVVAECGNPTVGNVEYVAFTPTSSVINFEVTGNDSGICRTVNPSFTINNQAVPSLKANLTLDNDGSTSNFAARFIYPNGDIVTIDTWDTGFENIGIPSSNEECVGGYTTAPTLAAGWTQVCIGNACQGPNCVYETYTGTLTLYGQQFKAPVDWVGSIDQTCTDVIYQPTFKPTKNPPIRRGDIAAMVLLGIFGLILLILTVLGFVLGFRSKYLISYCSLL